MVPRDHGRFAGLTFEDFRRMAGDDTLSPYEKIGFPDEYRAGAEAAILRDIAGKLGLERGHGRTAPGIRPGGSPPPRMISARCADREHRRRPLGTPGMPSPP